MEEKRTYIRRTDQEWLDIIQECRTSGLTDKAWCEQHHIDCSSFYHQIRRLRNKCYDIPRSSFSSEPSGMKQEVVPVEIQAEEEVSIQSDTSCSQSSFTVRASNKQTAIRLRVHNIKVEILNGADAAVIQQTLTALQSLC